MSDEVSKDIYRLLPTFSIDVRVLQIYTENDTPTVIVLAGASGMFEFPCTGIFKDAKEGDVISVPVNFKIEEL